MAWHPLPTLTPSNQLRWFRNIQIALEGKDLFWITKQTKKEFFDTDYYLPPVEGQPPHYVPFNGSAEIRNPCDRDRYYEVAEFKAFAYLWQGDSLSEEDKEILFQMKDQGKRPSFKNFWEALKNKYQEKPSTTKGELGDGEAAPPYTASPAS